MRRGAYLDIVAAEGETPSSGQTICDLLTLGLAMDGESSVLGRGRPMEPRLKSTPRVRGTIYRTEVDARGLRRDSTPAESALWAALRGRRLRGMKFRRQHAVGPYILDFCCPEHRLVVEVDGGVHDQQTDYDESRTEHLNTHGYRVLRFANAEVLTDLQTVLERVLRAASDGDSTSLRPTSKAER
jgi:very-short-patch-repair endonuclease